MNLTKRNNGTYELDVRGYVCPYPLMHFKKSLEQMASGEIIEVVFDFPGSLETIGMMCRKNNHKILDKTEKDGLFTLKIQKA